MKPGSFRCGGVILVGVGSILALFYMSAPSLPGGSQSFLINESETVRSISTRLEDAGVIRSSLLLRAIISFQGKDRHIQLGQYVFDEGLSALAAAKRITAEGPSMPLLSVTIPEGSTNKEVAAAVHKVLPGISEAGFLSRSNKLPMQGSLYPSTYALLPSYTEDDIIQTMTTTFTREYSRQFGKLPFPQDVKDIPQVLSLASILEGEAKTPYDMKVVSGILQNRLAIGMALQVDVVPETYQSRGIPLPAHNNPGSIAIDAVFHPIATDYLYYITGRDGTMYYAKTFTQHKEHIRKYLR